MKCYIFGTEGVRGCGVFDAFVRGIPSQYPQENPGTHEQNPLAMSEKLYAPTGRNSITITVAICKYLQLL